MPSAKLPSCIEGRTDDDLLQNDSRFHHRDLQVMSSSLDVVENERLLVDRICDPSIMSAPTRWVSPPAGCGDGLYADRARSIKRYAEGQRFFVCRCVE